MVRIGVSRVTEESRRAAGTAVAESNEREDERADAAPAQGFGSLADKLRGALEPRKK